MGFFKWLFGSNKQILRTEIVEETEGLDENDKFTNLAVGDMMGGFDGMVFADLYNQEHSATTTFKVTYTDGTYELIETENGSSYYKKYIKYLANEDEETTIQERPQIKTATTLSEAPEMIDSITEQVEQLNNELRDYLKNYTCEKCGKTMDVCICKQNKVR